MAQKYRVALGLTPGMMQGASVAHLTRTVLTAKEAETFSLTRATAIFYSEDPFLFMNRLWEDGYEPVDFNWINISKE